MSVIGSFISLIVFKMAPWFIKYFYFVFVYYTETLFQRVWAVVKTTARQYDPIKFSQFFVY